MYSHLPGLRDESAAEHNLAPRVTDDLFVAHRSLSQESQGTLAPRPRDARARSAARDVEAKTGVEEALNLYVKATGKDRARKRQELVNMKTYGDVSNAGKSGRRKCSASKTRKSKCGSCSDDRRASNRRSERSLRRSTTSPTG